MIRRRRPVEGTDPLFEVDTPALTPPKTADTTKALKWVRYKAKNPYPCDWCKADQASGERAYAASAARYTRQTETERQYLCYLHANLARRLDGLEGFKRR